MADIHSHEHFNKTFNLDDTAIVLLKKNVGILATFATKMKMPLVLTSSIVPKFKKMQGLLLEVIQREAPEAYEKRTQRQGIVNAWEDKNFADAVRATGKRQLIVAGVTTDVCLVPPALSMQAEGFHIKCVLDASGSPTDMVDQIAWQRLLQAGIPLASTNAIVTELVKNWATEAGQIAFPLLA